MFRTHNGPEWGFPYHLPAKQVDRARGRSREIWYHNLWPKQTRPLAWMLEHFAPIPGWHERDPKTEGDNDGLPRTDRLEQVMAAARSFQVTA
jgi:hypothetical protein